MIKQITFIFTLLLLSVSVSFPQKETVSAKDNLVEQLFEKTAEIFPAQEFSRIFESMNEAQRAKMEKDLNEGLTVKIENSALTPAQKAEIKQKIPDLTQRFSEIVKEIVVGSFKIDAWVDRSFRQNYSGLTTSELKQLNSYFKTKEGRIVSAVLRKFVIAGIHEEEAESEKNDEITLERFMKKPFGKKFFTLLTDQILADVVIATNEWSEQLQNEIEREMRSGRVKALVEEFLSTNEIA